MAEARRTESAATEAGRRREPRLEPHSVIHAHCADDDLRVLSLRNVSLGGFSIESNAETTPGVEKRFEFRTITGLEVRLQAVAIHCRPSETGRAGFISGWQFLVADAEAEEAVHALVDVLTSALLFSGEELGEFRG